MPEGTWWGLRFLDSKYLGNWSFSPYFEVYRHDGEIFRVKISGNHEIDPSLTEEQSKCMGFLGWDKEDRDDCDCFFSPYLDGDEALAWSNAAMDALQVVFGVGDACAIVGSNAFVNAEISKLEESHWSRKFGGYRFTSNLYNRVDLR
jgi:hypothetical protein